MSVIDGNFETQGTGLFFIDTVTASAPAVRKVTCPTGITGVRGGTADTIDTTCLDVVGRFRENIPGMITPGDLPIPFVLKSGDASHKALLKLQDSGAIVGWYIGLSDSQAAPTMDSARKNLISPQARTGFSFRGSVVNAQFDAATNEVVRGTLTVRPSGATKEHWAE